MNMISIDPDQCNACGVCVERCLKNYRQIGKGKDPEKSVTVHATDESCNLCGHCVSLCPEDAIVHQEMDAENFTTLNRNLRFDADQFDEFVRSRRSVRSFKKRAPTRNQLERLIDLCRYAPTGGNKQDVEILIIEDKERMAQLSALTLTSVAHFYPDFNVSPVDGSPIREDPIFHEAPVLMIFHQPKASGKTDSVIAAQTVVLSAMTHGLGSCYIGFLEYAWQHNEAVRELVDLPEDRGMGSALILGVPKLKYLKTVDRKPMMVRWG